MARKFVEYSDVGSTTGAVNFPQVQLPPRPAGTRFIQVQRNLPGELGRLNEVFARHKVNIAAQHYQTDGELGYVVLDADGQVPDAEDIDEHRLGRLQHVLLEACVRDGDGLSRH